MIQNGIPDYFTTRDSDGSQSLVTGGNVYPQTEIDDSGAMMENAVPLPSAQQLSALLNLNRPRIGIAPVVVETSTGIDSPQLSSESGSSFLEDWKNTSLREKVGMVATAGGLVTAGLIAYGIAYALSNR